MSGAELAPVVALRAPVAGEDELSLLRRAVDLPRLIEAGYDPGAQVIRPPREHPVFGYELCPVPRCTAAVESGGLCHACRARFKGFQGTGEEFVAIPRVFTQSGRAEQRLCLVCCTPGHERVGRCSQRAVFRLRAGPQGAQPGGRGVCGGRTASPVVRALCSLRALGRIRGWSVPLLSEAVEVAWQARPRAVRVNAAAKGRVASRGLEVDLSALAERPRLEILYGFQATWLDGGYAWHGTRRLQGVVDALVRAGAGSLLDEPVIEGGWAGELYRRLRTAVEPLLADPEREL